MNQYTNLIITNINGHVYASDLLSLLVKLFDKFD